MIQQNLAATALRHPGCNNLKLTRSNWKAPRTFFLYFTFYFRYLFFIFYLTQSLLKPRSGSRRGRSELAASLDATGDGSGDRDLLWARRHVQPPESAAPRRPTRAVIVWGLAGESPFLPVPTVFTPLAQHTAWRLHWLSSLQPTDTSTPQHGGGWGWRKQTVEPPCSHHVQREWVTRSYGEVTLIAPPQAKSK